MKKTTNKLFFNLHNKLNEKLDTNFGLNRNILLALDGDDCSLLRNKLYWQLIELHITRLSADTAQCLYNDLNKKNKER